MSDLVVKLRKLYGCPNISSESNQLLLDAANEIVSLERDVCELVGCIREIAGYNADIPADEAKKALSATVMAAKRFINAHDEINK